MFTKDRYARLATLTKGIRSSRPIRTQNTNRLSSVSSSNTDSISCQGERPSSYLPRLTSVIPQPDKSQFGSSNGTAVSTPTPHTPTTNGQHLPLRVYPHPKVARFTPEEEDIVIPGNLILIFRQSSLLTRQPGYQTEMPRHLPSGSQLPPCWTQEMDRLICWAEAEGIMPISRIVSMAKREFYDQLRTVSMTGAATRSSVD